MNIEKIKKELKNEIIYYEQIDSTQDEAKRIVNEKLSSGTIIITDNQTKGKGTKERKWYSAKEKNITMTIVYFPECSLKDLNGITVKIAEAIKSGIKELYNIDLQIKEPNDLILNNKKISGILTETSSILDTVKRMFIGIGFNVNQTEFPEETINIATSLKKEYGRDFDIEEIIIKIVQKLNIILE